MNLSKPKDLFFLSKGDRVSKRNLFDLIQYSKVEFSGYWGGGEFTIGNTPQQGINWVGKFPEVKAVIIKTRPGAYKQDGWSDEEKTTFRYSFKATNSKISYRETANAVLIGQPEFLYPIFLFVEEKNDWLCEGSFFVFEIEDEYVVLCRGAANKDGSVLTLGEGEHQEGRRRYVTHLMVERSKGVVDLVKNSKVWVCEICDIDFYERYGVNYIEAHHKTPISTFADRHVVVSKDLALLCPNCHKAVHIHMKAYGSEYDEIRKKLSCTN